MKKKYILMGVAAFCMLVSACDSSKVDTTPTTTIPTPTPTTDTNTPTPTPTTTVEEEEKQLADIGFYSSDFAYDGEEHEIVATKLAEGTYATYTDNKATETGVYYPTCNVYDSTTNELIQTYKAVLTIDKPENEEFNELVDEYFAFLLGDDYTAWNVFTYQPENLGFDRAEFGDASWYSYSKFDESEKPEIYAEFIDMKAELEAFDKDTLSNMQMASYRIIESLCDYYSTLYNPENNINTLIELRYVDSFGGYVANFASSMQGYHFRTEADITDVINIIDSTKDVFPTYVDYVNDRYEAGYAISDTTIDEMTSYLDEITEQGAEYYLYDVLTNKVDSTTFLSDEVKSTYKNTISTALTNSFLPAVSDLSAGLKECKGKLNAEDEGYFSQYGDSAKVYYELMLEDTLGIDLDMEEYRTYLNSAIRKYYNAYMAVYDKIMALTPAKRNEAIAYLYGEKTFVDVENSEEMLDFLKIYAKSLVPDLETMPEIHISEMDSTVAGITTTVAYYTKSTVDFMGDEYITTNPNYVGDDLNYSLFTLAHEGYPGHLYAYVHAKESELSNVAVISGVTGQGEGWAKYVELKLYDYISENYATESDPDKDPLVLICQYQYYNELINYLLEVAVDFGINYNGWGVSETAAYLRMNGFNEEIAQDLFDQLIEMPTSYAPYGYGMSYMLDLHTKAQEELGIYYNEIDFNKNVVLKEGEAGLGRLTELTDEYIAQVKYIYGLE